MYFAAETGACYYLLWLYYSDVLQGVTVAPWQRVRLGIRRTRVRTRPEASTLCLLKIRLVSLDTAP